MLRVRFVVHVDLKYHMYTVQQACAPTTTYTYNQLSRDSVEEATARSDACRPLALPKHRARGASRDFLNLAAYGGVDGTPPAAARGSGLRGSGGGGGGPVRAAARRGADGVSAAGAGQERAGSSSNGSQPSEAGANPKARRDGEALNRASPPPAPLLRASLSWRRRTSGSTLTWTASSTVRGAVKGDQQPTTGVFRRWLGNPSVGGWRTPAVDTRRP